MKIYILILLVSISIYGCNERSSSMESKIVNHIDSCNYCEIILKDITTFSWEKVYIFNTPASLEEIEKAIGSQYPNYKEFTRAWIFMKSNRIIYSENNPSNIEHVIKDQIIFEDEMDTDKYKIYTQDDIFLPIIKTDFKANRYFVLKKIM